MKIEIPKIFQGLFTPKRYKVYWGGRGSGKSQSFARALLIKAKQSRIRILCTREIQRSIKDSVHKLLKDQIYELELDNEFDVTEKNVTHINGSEFIFAGLHTNVHSIKSIEGIDICWVEEAHSVSENSWRVLIPTIRKNNSEIWISFNRDREDDPCYVRFVENKRNNAIIKKVNYYDNPFFPDVLKEEMEWDKKNDYDKYLHVWEGEPLIHSNAQIFKNKWRVEDFEAPENVNFYHGCDWGFSTDPFALIRCFIQDKKLYIDQEVYGTGIDIDKLPERFDLIDNIKRWVVIADRSRPETVSYMKRRGYFIKPSRGWPNCKEDRIEFLKSFEEIVIHERCKNTKYEFANFSYARDRLTDEILRKIVEKHDHAIDAITYALDDVMKNRKKLNLKRSDFGI